MNLTKKSTIGFYLICRFLFVIFLTEGFAQTTQKFSYADSLFKLAQYAAAAIEYDYIIYKTESSEERFVAIMHKVECLKQQKKYSDAIEQLEKINLRRIPENEQINVLYQLALVCYLNTDFERALLEIDKVLHLYQNSEKNADIVLLKILILNELYKWDAAKELLSKYFEVSDSSLVFDNKSKDELLFLYNFDKPKIKNPHKAALLSTFMPGVGQMYCGNILEGLFNGGLQLSALSGGVLLILNGYYVTGFFVAAGLFQTFYFGGIKRSAYLAEKKNYLHKVEFNQRIKTKLIQCK